MAIVFVLLCLVGWTIFLSFVWGEIQYKHDIVFFGTGIVLIVLSIFLDKTELPDYEQYVVYFRIAGDKLSLEPTLVFLSYLIRIFFNNEVFWGFVLYLLFGVTVKLVAIKRLSNLCFLSLSFYISSYWIYHEMIQIRAGVASAFFLMSLKPLYERKLKYFLIYALIAISFHYSAILILPLWFLNSSLKNRVFYTLLIPICMLLYVLHLDFITLLRYLPVPYIQNKIETYTMIAQIGSDRGLITADEYNPFITWYLLKAVIALLMWFNIKRISIHNQYAVLLLKIYTIGIVILWCLPSIPVAATRCSEFLSIVQIVLIPLVIYIANQRRVLYVIPILYGIAWIYWNTFSFLHI